MSFALLEVFVKSVKRVGFYITEAESWKSSNCILKRGKKTERACMREMRLK
jgi:hypothetical protein